MDGAGGWGKGGGGGGGGGGAVQGTLPFSQFTPESSSSQPQQQQQQQQPSQQPPQHHQHHQQHYPQQQHQGGGGGGGVYGQPQPQYGAGGGGKGGGGSMMGLGGKGGGGMFGKGGMDGGKGGKKKGGKKGGKGEKGGDKGGAMSQGYSPYPGASGAGGSGGGGAAMGLVGASLPAVIPAVAGGKGKGKNHHHQHQQQQQNQQQQNAAGGGGKQPRGERGGGGASAAHSMLLYAVSAPETLPADAVDLTLSDVLAAHNHRSNIPHRLRGIRRCYTAALSPEGPPLPASGHCVVSVAEAKKEAAKDGTAEGEAEEAAEKKVDADADVDEHVAEEEEGEDAKTTADRVSVLLLCAPPAGEETPAALLRNLRLATADGGAALLGAGSAVREGESVAEAAVRAVRARNGVDLTALSPGEEGFIPFARFEYKASADGAASVSHVLLARAWDKGMTVEGGAGLQASALFDVLLAAEVQGSETNFELVAVADMLFDMLKLSVGARVLDALEARTKDAEAKALASSTELSVLDVDALKFTEIPSGNLDKKCLAEVARAMGKELSAAELDRLMEKLIVDKKPAYASLATDSKML